MATITRRTICAVSIAVSVALLATACSGETFSANSIRKASAAGNPVDLGPIDNRPDGTGDRAPLFTGSIITPETGISTSLSPTLSAGAGATGAWKFVLTDVGGKGTFSRTYDSSGSTTRVPLAAGLVQGNVYTWRATSATGDVRGGTFTVDVQNLGAQGLDQFGGIDVGLSSGEASLGWTSHSVSARAGDAMVQFRFIASNTAQLGMPAGWQFQATSGSTVQSLLCHVTSAKHAKLAWRSAPQPANAQ